MSLETSIAKLNDAAKDLRATWREVDSAWRDRNAAAFHARYGAEINASVKKALTAMARLDGMLYQARRDCQ